ncbi:MAG: ABC transporter substrate binding protein [Solidesulfovibrio sp. DCME]|uniref:sensor histidine kinase n=1 Tax=Solidesulfovibrio sp. DCME TaxID=3447380 RepID=UPI003D0CFA9A
MFSTTRRFAVLLRFLCLGSLLALLSCLHAPGAAAADGPAGVGNEKRVAILYSMPLDFPATQLVEQGLREALSEKTPFAVQAFSEYLDLSRFRHESQRQALADLLRQRYGAAQIDLVIAVDVPATHFLIEHAQDVFPGIPVVVCDIPEPDKENILASSFGKRVSGVLEPAQVARELVTSAFRLKPQARHAVLIYGAFENDAVRAIVLRQAITALYPRVELLELGGLSIGEILDRCQKLPPDSLIFFSTLFVDAKGRFFVPREVIPSLANYSGCPIWGLYDSYFGSGVVGGPMVSMRLQGLAAGKIALRILSGRPAGEIPFNDGLDTKVTVYDWRQLDRFHLDENALPPDATVVYREATLWGRYRYYIIGAAILFTLQSALVIGLFVNLRQRKKAEIALRESQRELQTLAGRLISSQEGELSRLSREFHDDFVQRLAAVAIEIGTIELHTRPSDERARAGLVDAKEKIINLSEDMHALSRELHPSILKDFGLVRAVAALCRNFTDREGLDVACAFQGAFTDIPLDTALCLYRVIQEGLRNIVKHAQARHVDISLEGTDDRLVLVVRDDGKGFKPLCARLTPGIGLASMRERVQYASGDFAIQSEPGQGTVIHVSVPVGEERHAQAENPAGR